MAHKFSEDELFYDSLKADIINLGVILFILVTGVNGFQDPIKDEDKSYGLIKKNLLSIKFCRQ